MQKKQQEKITRYKEVFSSESGKMVLADLMSTFSVLDSTFDPDPYIHAYNEGARSVVMRVLKTINTDPEHFKKIVAGKLEEQYEI